MLGGNGVEDADVVNEYIFGGESKDLRGGVGFSSWGLLHE